MRILFILCLLSVYMQTISAQDSHLIDGVRKADSLLWAALGRCDIGEMKKYYSSDVEFYHDKNGIISGADVLAAYFMNGPCSNADSLTPRSFIAPESYKIYLMQEKGETYGAVVTGGHLLYAGEKGIKERPVGSAKFTSLWLLDGGAWKVKRILTYDYQAVAFAEEKPSVAVANAVLRQYSGKYHGRRMGTLIVQHAKGYLIMTYGKERFNVYPVSTTNFTAKHRDLTFEFSKKPAGIMDVIVREQGAVVETFTAARR